MAWPEMVTGEETAVVYWQALAEERGRQLEELRALLLAAIESIGDGHVGAFVTALDTSRPSWLRELDLMPSTVTLRPAQVEAVLEDLWRQVAADRIR